MSEDTFVYSELSTNNGYLQIGEYPHLGIVYDASTKILNITCIDSESNQACDKHITLLDFIKKLKIPISDIARAYSPPSTVETYIAEYNLQPHIDKAMELLPQYFDKFDVEFEIFINAECIGDHYLIMSISCDYGIGQIEGFKSFEEDYGYKIRDASNSKLSFSMW